MLHASAAKSRQAKKRNNSLVLIRAHCNCRMHLDVFKLNCCAATQLRSYAATQLPADQAPRSYRFDLFIQ